MISLAKLLDSLAVFDMRIDNDGTINIHLNMSLQSLQCEIHFAESDNRSCGQQERSSVYFL
ncbi:hypothetical protein A7X88_06830 [Stenotrophomonas maltophilia]|nr:hypothetical protein A7X88_06830 [Stenotrophomonas maltophilia]